MLYSFGIRGNEIRLSAGEQRLTRPNPTAGATYATDNVIRGNEKLGTTANSVKISLHTGKPAPKHPTQRHTPQQAPPAGTPSPT